VDNTNVRAWGNLFTENRAEGDGGGVYHNGGSSEHNDSLIEMCTAGADGAGNGGGICFVGGTNRWIGGIIRANMAIGSGNTNGIGGGVCFQEVLNGLVQGAEITQNVAPKGAGIYMAGPASGPFSVANVRNCTIAFNSSPGQSGAGIHASGQELGEIVNNVISHQVDGFGIACNSPASPNIRYNDVFNSDVINLDAEYGVDCPDRTGLNGNIRVDPLFCSIIADPPDLAVASNSQVLDAGEGGTHMGAYGASVACGTISVEESSWGKIKSLYR
jgi:hypothetical protein